MKTIQKLVNTSLASLYVISLAACNGTSGENGSDPFGEGSVEPAPEITLSVVTKTADCSADNASFVSGDSICVEATLLQDNQAFSGEIVTFSAGLGEVSIDSRLTDANGIAQIQISSDGSEIGAASIVASYEEASVSSNYEYLSNGQVVEETTTLNVSMQLNGAPTSRFSGDQQVTVVADLFDADAQPLVNEIVQFSTTLGVLTPDRALTNENGRAQVIFTANEGDLGADTLTAQYQAEELIVSNGFSYQILAADEIAQEVIRFGHFDENGLFVENELGVSVQADNGDVIISAGATLGVSVALVDENEQRILTPTPVTFSSNCVQNELARIDAEVSTINGEASSTFEDVSCAGASGNTDTITATLVTSDDTLVLTQQIELLAEALGSIEFVSAQPQSITLSGTGGQGNTSVSTLTFQVNGALGNPLAQQEVNFALNTETGGLSLSPESGFTNSQGQVSTRVTAGNVPTAVRVTATTSSPDGTQIQTQSDLLAVNTGLPDQNSFTLSPSVQNPEAFNINGQEVTIIARLSDTFNNPVPDGTSISFTTEGGTIQPSCNTLAGACSVIWTSSEPRVEDHRVTILATAIGHETLFDANGNNSFDDEENNPILDNSDSGFVTSSFGQIGFVDMSEAWRDDDEDLVRDSSELFLDYDSNGQFDDADGLFNGPQCLSDSFCGTGIYASLHVRKATVLVTSSSSALIDIEQADGTDVSSNYRTVSQPAISISRGGSESFTFFYSDTAEQPIASGSTVVVETANGSLGGNTSFTFGSTNQNARSQSSFTLINSLGDEDTSIDTVVTVTITSPSDQVSSTSFTATLE